MAMWRCQLKCLHIEILFMFDSQHNVVLWHSARFSAEPEEEQMKSLTWLLHIVLILSFIADNTAEQVYHSLIT